MKLADHLNIQQLCRAFFLFIFPVNSIMQSILKPKLRIPKTPISFSQKVSCCHTCNSPIDDLPCRFLVVKDEFNKHKMLKFHYFFPCWDVEFVFQNLVGLTISKAGFIFDESIKKNPKIMNNIDLWDINQLK